VIVVLDCAMRSLFEWVLIWIFLSILFAVAVIVPSLALLCVR
jgi:hypothetical protein